MNPEGVVKSPGRSRGGRALAAPKPLKKRASKSKAKSVPAGHISFGNSWWAEFSSPRSIIDEARHVEARKAHDADGDDLGLFFIDSRDTTAPLEVDVVESFCQGTNLEYVEKGKGSAGSLRKVWLDDRSSPGFEGSGDTRVHENPLTATGLLRALAEKQFNHEKLCNGARRLIYVSDLNPDCIHALAATASSLHARALRSTIYRHLVFRPSVGVKIPSAGCLRFQLELHLPFFIMRGSTPPDKTPHGTVKTKPDRGWTDLSFLRLDACDSNSGPSEPEEVWCMQEAQISCVVTGTDDWRWTGYGFVDAEVDSELAEATESDMRFDQIAGSDEVEANHPIWRPRDWWIKVYEVRIDQVTGHYENLVHKLNSAFDQYMKDHPFSLSPRRANSRHQTTEIQAAFEWTLQMMRVLTKPRNVLLATIEAWRAFDSEDGDVQYFSDDLHAAAGETNQAFEASAARCRSMKNIKAKYCELRGYLSEIVALDKSCADYKQALELRLSLGQKETADKNEFTNIFTVNLLYPIGLAAAVFSMQQDAMPFPQTPKAFGITAVVFIWVVAAIQSFVIHAQPWLWKTVKLWLERGVREETNGIMPDALVKKKVEIMKGGVQERVTDVTDEESVTPKMSRDKSRTWKSWVTRSSTERTLVG